MNTGAPRELGFAKAVAGMLCTLGARIGNQSCPREGGGDPLAAGCVTHRWVSLSPTLFVLLRPAEIQQLSPAAGLRGRDGFPSPLGG